jgi:hypothetical protein
VPIFPDTPDGCAARVDYYEPSRLNNLPNSQLDDNDAMRGLEPPAEHRAREQRDNPLPNRPTAIKMSPFRQNTTATSCVAVPRKGDAQSIAGGGGIASASRRDPRGAQGIPANAHA